MRRRCATCGHGYGVHEIVRTPLIISKDRVEAEADMNTVRHKCTGYPDQMGTCDCRLFADRLLV